MRRYTILGGKVVSDKLRFGHIGCGGIADARLRRWQQIVEKGADIFSIEAPCDVRWEAVQNYAEEIAA